MQTLNYRIRLLREEEGGYTVIVPALPGCVTFGETIDEAIEMAREAIEGYIETLKELGKEVPKDNDILEYTVSVEAYGFIKRTFARALCMQSFKMPTSALRNWQN